MLDVGITLKDDSYLINIGDGVVAGMKVVMNFVLHLKISYNSLPGDWGGGVVLNIVVNK